MVEPMRRQFLIAVLARVVACPAAANAKEPMPVVGFLNSASPGPFAPLLAAFHTGLKDGGYVEGQNVKIEYRWAEGQYDRLPTLEADPLSRTVPGITPHG